jgi:spermidine synthase
VGEAQIGTGTRVFMHVFFFLSGLVSLVYQVVWVRILALFFGSDVYSASTTLSVFMGGLALGSWLASRYADRIARPLLAYGICEIIVSLAALAVPTVLAALTGAYRLVYLGSFDSAPWLYHGFRVLVAATAMLVPTTLMGATLPLLVRAFARHMSDLGRHTGWLYALNTLGALVGSIAAGFVLLPMLGVASTIHTIVAVGLLVGAGSIVIGSKVRVAPSTDQPVIEEPSLAHPDSTRREAILLVVALSGMAALALEVVWMRILVHSFSATVYAFSIMLACFLFGLYCGSAKAATTVDRHPRPVHLLANLQFGLALAVALLAVLTYLVPKVFGSLVWMLADISGGAFGAASVIAQFVVASGLILGPTVMLGAMFPIAVRAVTPRIEQRAAGAGRVYAANTAGAIVGALLGGFVLVPLAGTRAGLVAIAAVFAVNGSILAGSAVRGRPFKVLAAAALASLVALLLPRQTVANYDLQRSMYPEVIYHGDGVSNTVDIVRNDRDETIMMINGNVEADTSLLQRRHFILKAYLPLLLHPAPRDVAVVGLGLGITLAATARYPGVENIQLVELSPDMVAAHEHLRAVTGDILRNPKVHLRIDDGRNFMAMTDDRYDMITADPVHPRITGIGYLYTREYYEAIKARLRPGGVVTQWMPMYNISPASFDVAFRTFASVFPHATFWYVRGHGLFVATAEPTRIHCKSLEENFAVPAVKADFASIGIASPADFLGLLLMDDKHISEYLERREGQEINTDDNAWLEYRTPFEFLYRTDVIVPELVRHAGWSDADVFAEDCSPEFRKAAHDAFERRLKRVIPELGEAIS